MSEAELLAADLLRLRDHGGFAGEQPKLSASQLNALAALVRPSLDQQGRVQFDLFVQNIFANAVRNVAALEDAAGPQPARVKNVLKDFIVTLEKSAAAIDGLDPTVEALIEDRFAERRARQPIAQASRPGPPAVSLTPKTSIVLWKRNVLELIDTVLAEAERIEIKTVKGASGAAYRQMVRALAALVRDITGQTPKRSSKRYRDKFLESSMDHYWFLGLCRALAAEVQQEAAMAIARRLRDEEQRLETAAVASLEAGTDPGRQKTNDAKGRRSGPPSLARIVREELELLEKEA